VATAEGLAPGTYADVVTNDLVLRSEPGVSGESEIFPDELNAPLSVYVADGPVEADGYRWFLVVAFDEAGSDGGLTGWAAAEGKDGEVWLEPVNQPAAGEWAFVAADDAPPDLNTRSAAMGPDGSIYFFGGVEWTDSPSGHAWSFDSATGAWRELSPMPTPRARPLVAATEDGRFYVIGGAPGDTVSSDDSSVVEVYDAETDRWSSAADAPVTPGPHGVGIAFAVSDGTIRLFDHDRLLTYDLTTDEWGEGATEGETWWDAAPGAGTEMHVLAYEGSVLPLDVESGAFGEGVEPPGITRYGAALAIGSDGRTYVIGGSVAPGLGATCTGWRMGGGALSAAPIVEAFDPAPGEWTTIAPLPTGLTEAAAFTTEEGILVVGLTAHPDNEVTVARLSLPQVVASAPLAYANQEVSPSGCGAP